MKALVFIGAGTCDGKTLVKPSDAEGSFLMAKLTGTVPTDCGDPMPPVGPLLADSELACVRGWIESLSADAAMPEPGCDTCGTSACIDFTSDAAHCGDCDAACPSGASCEAGQCVCPADLALCGGRCTDTLRDSAHCGACGKACGSGEVCEAGQCVCGTGLEACGTQCVELASDPDHCGDCGAPCGKGKLCTPTGCQTGGTCGGTLSKCGSSCVDTKVSFFHCGGCNMPCDAGETCTGGTCGCPGGGALCNGTCVDTQIDDQDCGGCGNVCPSGTSCNNGACECPGGGSACGSSCVDLQADEANCGACGRSCAPGQLCEAGSCACGNASVSFASQVAPVLDAYCTNAGCHVGTRAKEGLDLTPAKAYAELVEVKAAQCNDGRLLVEPGAPEQSYLMQKMLGVSMCSGSQMPKAGVSIPQRDLEALSAWICQGAPK